MRKEAFLPLHDGGADSQNGVKALLNVLDKPTRFLQTLLQGSVAGGVFATHLVPLKCVGVNVMHP
jgi:hypothetical protein